MLEDLNSVGAEKAVGFMTAEIAEYQAQRPVSEIRQLFEDKGLQTRLLDERDCWNQTDTLYVYDEEKLGLLLEDHSALLDSIGWPQEPEEFIKAMAGHWADVKTPLYDLIADCFGNKEDYGRTDVDIPADTQDPYWQGIRAQLAARNFTPRGPF